MVADLHTSKSDERDTSIAMAAFGEGNQHLERIMSLKPSGFSKILRKVPPTSLAKSFAEYQTLF
jgi:hypothetical protein